MLIPLQYLEGTSDLFIAVDYQWLVTIISPGMAQVTIPTSSVNVPRWLILIFSENVQKNSNHNIAHTNQSTTMRISELA